MAKPVQPQQKHHHQQQQRLHQPFQQLTGVKNPFEKCIFGISLAAKDLECYTKRMCDKMQRKIRQRNRARQEIRYASEQASLYKHFVMIEHVMTVKDQETKLMEEMEELRRLRRSSVEKMQIFQQIVIKEQNSKHIMDNVDLVRKKQYEKEHALRTELHEIQSRLCLKKKNTSGIINLRAAIAA